MSDKSTKILLIVLMALLSFSLTSMAQRRPQERIQAVKVGYITNKIKLSEEQAVQFWPVYNRYEEDMMQLRKRFIKKFRNEKEDFREKEPLSYIENNLDFQEAVISLKRTYKDEFLKVISARQLADLYIAEKEFRQMVIQKLRERRAQRK